MIQKKIIIGLTSIFSLSISVAIPAIATSCSSKKIYKDNPLGIKFISERSFSLRFVGENKRDDGKNETIGLFGTAWLLGKDQNAYANSKVNQTYYLGTNLHVAAAINNKEKKYKAFNGVEYQEKKWPTFNRVEFGQIGTFDKNNVWNLGTTMNSNVNNSVNSFVHYCEYLDLNDENISVSYTTFDLMDSLNLVDKDNVYNEKIIKNGTMDFAILKVDFLKRKKINNLNNDSNVCANSSHNAFTDDGSIGDITNMNSPINQSLKIYDNNPTKFAANYDKNSLITVAGFPAKKEVFTSEWNSMSNMPSKLSDFGHKFLGKKDWDYMIYETNIETIKSQYALLGDIEYVAEREKGKQVYASQRNVAYQSIFSNLNLSGGSSGSMAINEKNEVVGIYWGIYEENNGNVLGVIDNFVAPNILRYRSGSIAGQLYNVVNDIKNKIPNIKM